LKCEGEILVFVGVDAGGECVGVWRKYHRIDNLPSLDLFYLIWMKKYLLQPRTEITSKI